MDGRLLGDTGGARTFVIVFDTDDEVSAGLLSFARAQNIDAASFTGIGAFRSVTLGYFDLQKRDYTRIAIADQVEVLSLIGNVALAEDGPKLHAHVVVGKADGTAHGGHLIDGRVRPTLEIILVETPSHLRRRSDPATGLALIDAKAR
jgi:predicted DNA-binding protein with PD1-like motif